MKEYDNKNVYEYIIDVSKTYEDNHSLKPKNMVVGSKIFNDILNHVKTNNINVRMNNYSHIFINNLNIINDKRISHDSYIIGP
jgi:hypothetical protein